MPERGGILAQVAERAVAVGRHRVAVDVDAVEDLVVGVEALALRRDHRDGVAGGGERRRLEPDPAVEGHRQVLDDDQHPAPRPRASADASPPCRGSAGPAIAIPLNALTLTPAPPSPTAWRRAWVARPQALANGGGLRRGEMPDDRRPPDVLERPGAHDPEESHDETPARAPRAPRDPALSVIIACRNGAATLLETLEGLAAQAWDRPWEVVLADNGSTDGSVALFEGFARAQPQLAMRVVDAAARRGKPFALNTAIAAARAPAVAVCDADDVPGEGWLAAMGAALERHAIVACRIDFDRLNAGWIRRTPGRAAAGRARAAGVPASARARRRRHHGGAAPAGRGDRRLRRGLRLLRGHRVRPARPARRARDRLRARGGDARARPGRPRADLPAELQLGPLRDEARQPLPRPRRRLRRRLGPLPQDLAAAAAPQPAQGPAAGPETMPNAAWLRAGAGRLSGQLAGMLRYRVPPYRGIGG